MIFQEILFGWKMNPTLAEGGVKALAELRRAAREGNPYPLVLTDAMMPEMDGFELAAQIASDPQLASTHVLMISSASDSKDLARCREVGISRCLPKPVKQSSLLDAIVNELGMLVEVESAHADSLDRDTSTRSLRLLLAAPSKLGQRKQRSEIAADPRIKKARSKPGFLFGLTTSVGH